MDIIINLDRGSSSKYDESLSTVYVLDYGDNYHRIEGEPSSEFELAVRSLKGRYRDLSKYNNASSLYYEWMDYLAELHGGHDLLKKKIKAGFVNEFVPKKPRLKDTKSLKFLYKNKIMVSSVGRNIVDEDKLDELLEIYSDIDPTSMTIAIEKDKDAIKIANEMDESFKRIKSKGFSSDADFLNAYFNNRRIGGKKHKNDKKKKKHKHKKEREGFLISDFMNDNYYENLVEESDNAPMMMYGTMLLSSGMTKDINVYHKLNDCGWNSYKMMKSAGYSKRTTSLFKEKKKKGKKKKKYKPYDECEDLLIDIMTDSNYDDFESFQRDMLSMTSEDLFK